MGRVFGVVLSLCGRPSCCVLGAMVKASDSEAGGRGFEPRRRSRRTTRADAQKRSERKPGTTQRRQEEGKKERATTVRARSGERNPEAISAETTPAANPRSSRATKRREDRKRRNDGRGTEATGDEPHGRQRRRTNVAGLSSTRRNGTEEHNGTKPTTTTPRKRDEHGTTPAGPNSTHQTRGEPNPTGFASDEATRGRDAKQGRTRIRGKGRRTERTTETANERGRTEQHRAQRNSGTHWDATDENHTTEQRRRRGHTDRAEPH